jgi:polyhydroxyalkanoate synthesis repressor PhaR
MRIIYRYGNRKLYDSQVGEYITLGRLKDFVIQGETFAVHNRYSRADETFAALCQILHHQAKEGATVAPALMFDLIREAEGSHA